MAGRHQRSSATRTAMGKGKDILFQGRPQLRCTCYTQGSDPSRGFAIWILTVSGVTSRPETLALNYHHNHPDLPTKPRSSRLSDLDVKPKPHALGTSKNKSLRPGIDCCRLSVCGRCCWWRWRTTRLLWGWLIRARSPAGFSRPGHPPHQSRKAQPPEVESRRGRIPGLTDRYDI